MPITIFFFSPIIVFHTNQVFCNFAAGEITSPHSTQIVGPWSLGLALRNSKRLLSFKRHSPLISVKLLIVLAGQYCFLDAWMHPSHFHEGRELKNNEENKDGEKVWRWSPWCYSLVDYTTSRRSERPTSIDAY